MSMADWYAEADFVIHADMKSHVGGLLNMGRSSK